MTSSQQGEPTITRYSAAELGTNHSYSINRARSDLGYNPTIDREEGLKRFYEWFMPSKKTARSTASGRTSPG